MSAHLAIDRDAMGRRILATDAAFVALAFLGGFSFWPALIALGSLFETLAGKFGWSRSQVTTAQLIFTAASVVGAPVVGPLIDRVCVRPLLLLGLAIVPVPLALIGRSAGSYTAWIAVWIAASLAG
jgi:sugar phosphate permease